MNEQIKSIKLKNYHLFFLQGLLNVPLSGKESRARNQFLILTEDRRKEIETERQRILSEFKEEENKDEMNRIFSEILNEDFIIDILPSNEQLIPQVKTIIEASTKELNIEEGMLYDQILTAFEKI